MQFRDFYGSNTTLSLAHVGAVELSRLANELALELTHPDAEGLFILRHTLMNPWLLSLVNAQEESYVAAYCHFVAQLVKSSGEILKPR